MAKLVFGMNQSLDGYVGEDGDSHCDCHFLPLRTSYVPGTDLSAGLVDAAVLEIQR